MDVFDFVRNRGEKEIANPNYNPKSKKNTQPATIKIPDLEADDNRAVELGVMDFNNQWSISQKEYEKYADYGLNYSPYRNMEKELAYVQSNWTKAFNMLSQTLVSELGLGTAKAFSDIADFVSSKIFHLTEDDYQNPVSEKLKEWQDTFNEEIAPIYADPDVNIQNGGLGDFGWWMKNMPQVASTLTLLIPTQTITGLGRFALKGLGKTLGAVEGTSKAAKAARLIGRPGETVSKARRWAANVGKVEDAEKLSKWRAWLGDPITVAKGNAAAESVVGGAIMRTIENYQEAHDTYTQTYENAFDTLSNMSDEQYDLWLTANQDLFNDLTEKNKIDVNNREAVAKHISKKAADRTFAMDYSNIIFDIIQLHSLKNIGKGVKEVTNSSARRANKEAIQNAITAVGGKAEEAAKKNIFKTAGIATRDFLKYNTKTILAESTEGIEEAVNYIAQQEGLTYGKSLLDGTAKKYDNGVISSWADMQGNLVDYAKTAELQESAFWGVFGGWLFQGAGSLANKVKMNIHEKAARKAREENEITGERTATTDERGNDFLSLFDMAETRAAKEAIHRRHARLSQLSNDIKLINAGKDITKPKLPNGEFQEFSGNVEAEKEIAIKRKQQEFLADVAVDAINSGTFNLMLEYFQSKEVKDAMVKVGILTQAEADSNTEFIVKKLEAIRDKYQRHSAHVLNQISAINLDRGINRTIPLEYAQIIAAENFNHSLEVDQLNAEIDAHLAQIVKLENDAIADLADSEKAKSRQGFADAKRSASISALTSAYMKIADQIREVEQSEAPTLLDKLDKQETLNGLNAQKQNIISRLKDYTIGNTNLGISAVFNAIRESYGKIVNNPNGTQSVVYEKEDKDIIKEARSLFEDKSDISDDAVIQGAKAIVSDVNRFLKNKDGFLDSNPALGNAYIDLAGYETRREIVRSQINNSKSSILSRIEYYDTKMNEVRAKKVTEATDILMKAYEQYKHIKTSNGSTLAESIISTYQFDKEKARRIAEEILPEESSDDSVSVSEFMDALDILNLTGRNGKDMFTYVLGILKIQEKLSRQSNETTSQENTGNGQAITASESSQPITPSSQPTNGNSGQQNSSQTSSLISSSDPRQAIRINVIFNNRGNITNIRRSNSSNGISARLNPDGTVELDISSLPKNQQLAFIRNGMFDTVYDSRLSDPNTTWSVSTNPTLIKQGNKYVIKDLGHIEFVEASSPVEGNVASQESTTSDEANTDTVTEVTEEATSEETSASPEATVAPEQEQQSQQAPIPTPAPTPASQSIPSTGEGSIAGTQLATNADEEVMDEVDRRMAIGKAFANHVSPTTSSDEDVDAAIALVKQELSNILKRLGLSEDDLNEELNQYAAQLKSSAAFFRQLKGIEKTGAELANAARINDLRNPNTFDALFVSAVTAFMEEYAKVIMVPVVDGKQVVYLRDVMNICMKAYPSADTTEAKAFFATIKRYLISNPDIYSVVDIEESDTIVDNLNKDIQQEERTIIQTHRVNILDNIKMAEVNADGSQYFKLLQSLKNGDKLDMFVTDKQIILSKNGITIGSMTKASRVGDTYHQITENWKTDVKLDSNGNAISKVKDVIEYLFTGSTSHHQQLQQLLMKAVINGQINNSDILSFVNNALIAQILKDYNKSNSVIAVDGKDIEEDKKLYEHLVKLWKYTAVSSTSLSKQETIDSIKTGLNNFYIKLYEEYSGLDRITSNGQVTIDKITEGQLLKVTEDTTTDYDSLPLPSEAIASNSDAHIAIVDSRDSTRMLVAGLSPRSSRIFNAGTTVMAFSSRNEKLDYCKIWGLKLLDNVINTDSSILGKLLKASTSALSDTITQMILNRAFGNTQNLVNIINQIIDTTDANVLSLFRAYKLGGKFQITYTRPTAEKPLDAITINYYEGNRQVDRLTIYRTTTYGQAAYQRGADKPKFRKNDISEVDFGNEVATEFMKFISDKCTVNIGQQGIEADSGNTLISGSFFTYKNGKLKVNVKAILNDSENSYYEEDFDSYNDFLVKGNLIRVNTKKSENNSNFVPRGNRQTMNQVLYVSLQTTSPVESNNATQTTTTANSKVGHEVVLDTSNKEEVEVLKALTRDKDVHFGREAFKKILGEDALRSFDEANTEFDILADLLPEQIFYDKNLNYYPGDGSVLGAKAFSTGAKVGKSYSKYDNKGKRTVGKTSNRRWFIVGPAWMNLAASRDINKRKEAIRTLIHEKLHTVIQSDEANRRKALDTIKEVYQEFRDEIEKDLATLDKSIPLYNWLKQVKNVFNSYSNDVQLEEFLVESLTSQGFFDYLNSKQREVTDNGKSDTLFTKIAKAIAKFFGWKINDNSLYMKELNALRDLVNTDSFTEAVDEKVEEFKENAETQQEAEQEAEKEAEKEAEQEAEQEPEEMDEFERQLRETMDLDSLYAQDTEYEDEVYDDDEANASNIDDVNLREDGYIAASNFYAVRDRLPLSIQARFDQLVNDGTIETLC